MILLNGHSLKQKNYIQPEAMSLNLEERNSTATMTLGPEAPEISVGEWLQDDTEPGKGIVWRVRMIQESVETQTRTVTLEHVINTLKDRVLFGETKPATIAGVDGATEVSARAAINHAMARQDDWRLGETAKDPVKPYSFNGENLFSVIETVTSSMGDVQWEYDLSSHPFTLHIRNIPTGFSSEMRMSRNITTLRHQIDRSRMYTRIYPIGKDNLHVSGEYLSKNEGTWGIVCKVETDQSKETEGALREWAQERLNRHCEPTVTITISGLDLSRETGEALDKITLGRRCRVPLPAKGETITERVTKLQWADKIKEPGKFTVTLANNTEDIASIVNRIQEAVESGRGGGGRYGASKNEEDHAWFVDTDEHVGMVAEAVAGPGADKDWSRVASIFVDGEGIHQKVTQAQGEIVEHETRIEANEYQIRLEAEKRIAEDKSLQGQINVEAGKVSMVVGTRSGENYIKAAQICVAINEDGSSQAVIEASKIHLLGQTIANTITAELIQSKVNLMASLRVKQLTVATRLSFEGSGTTITGSQAADIIRNLRIQQSGNNYTLQKITCGDGSWQDVASFSRAIAQWSLGWSGGVFTAKATPQNQSCYTEIAGGTPEWDGRKVTIPINARNSSAPGTIVSTGKSVEATAPDPEWGWSYYASEGGSMPSGVAKAYDLDTRYQYHWIDVTVDGSTRRFLFRT